MRSTQGMHESQPITSFRRKWARVVRCGRLFPSPFTGAVHNRRHSGESRNPEGKGNPRHSRLQTTPSPHIINVIPAHLTRHSCKSSTPSRTSSTPFPRTGAVHNLAYDGFTVRSRAPPRCPAPLDSGFRRNDGSYAQHPDAGTQRKQTTPLFIIAREKRLFLCVPGYPRPRV